MKRLANGLVTILAMLFLTGFACYGSENVIYGCYQKNNGQLRIVKNIKECRRSELPIFWNQVGPQGPQGPHGPAGPQGPAGTVVTEIVHEDRFNYDINNNTLWGIASCAQFPEYTYTVTGGGFSVPQGVGVTVIESRPLEDGTGWKLVLALPGDTIPEILVTVWAVCVQVQ